MGEIIEIVKGVLSSPSFWLVIGFQVYVITLLFCMFFIHPLTIIIVPLLIVGLLMYRERKHDKLLIQQYMRGYTFKDPKELVKAYALYLKKMKDNERHRKQVKGRKC